VVVDDVFHAVGTKDQPVSFATIERHLLDLARRFRVVVLADQWQARQLIERVRRAGVEVAEVSIGAAYHDRIARSLIDLAQLGRVRLFPHAGLITQLRSVVLRRSSAIGRDDSSVRVRIDSGAGAGVAGKDDLVVALAAASFEATDRRRLGPAVAFCTVRGLDC
jgi:hypothetical protein